MKPTTGPTVQGVMNFKNTIFSFHDTLNILPTNTILHNKAKNFPQRTDTCKVMVQEILLPKWYIIVSSLVLNLNMTNYDYSYWSYKQTGYVNFLKLNINIA